MPFIGAIIATMLDVVEAEGRLLRRAVVATVHAAAWILVSVTLAAAGAGLVLYAIYLEGSAMTGRPSAGALVAGIAAIGGSSAVWLIARSPQRPRGS